MRIRNIYYCAQTNTSISATTRVKHLFAANRSQDVLNILAHETRLRSELKLPVTPIVIGTSYFEMVILQRPKSLDKWFQSMLFPAAGLYRSNDKVCRVCDKHLRNITGFSMLSKTIVIHEMTHAAQHATYPRWFNAKREINQGKLRARLAWIEGHAKFVEDSLRNDLTGHLEGKPELLQDAPNVTPWVLVGAFLGAVVGYTISASYFSQILCTHNAIGLGLV